MPVKIDQPARSNTLEIQISGKLAHADYQQFVPVFERILKEKGKLRVLFEMIDFHGWDGSAVWDDIKFDVKHFSDLEKVAMVGDKKWEKGMSFFCKPFTAAKVRYFDRSEIEQARTWLSA